MNIEVGQVWLTGTNEYFITKITPESVTYELNGKRDFTIDRRTMERIIEGKNLPFRVTLKTRTNQTGLD